MLKNVEPVNLTAADQQLIRSKQQFEKNLPKLKQQLASTKGQMFLFVECDWDKWR